MTELVGSAVEYEHLRKLIAERRKELRLSQLDVDELAGVQTGYTGKIECGARHFGDVSLGCILGALGLKLDVMRSVATYKNISDATEASLQKLRGRYKKIGSIGGAARASKMSEDERRAACRRAAKKRWSDWRAAKAEKERKSRRASKRAPGID